MRSRQKKMSEMQLKVYEAQAKLKGQAVFKDDEGFECWIDYGIGGWSYKWRGLGMDRETFYASCRGDFS